jgi:hypothetical protein
MSDLTPDQRAVVAAIEELAARLPHEPPAALESTLLRAYRARISAAGTTRWSIARPSSWPRRAGMRGASLAAAAVLAAAVVAAAWLLLARSTDAPAQPGFAAAGRVAVTPDPATAPVFLQIDNDAVGEMLIVRVRVPATDARGGEASVLADVWVGEDGVIHAVRVLEAEQGAPLEPARKTSDRTTS